MNSGFSLPYRSASTTTPTTTGGLFGQPPKPAENSAPAATSTAPAGGLFGGGLFGKPPTPVAPAASTSAASTSKLHRFNLIALPYKNFYSYSYRWTLRELWS